MWRLTETNLKILRFIQLQARTSARTVSKTCGIKEHAVLYAFRKLRERGLLASRPLINFSRLGYTEYDLYLRLSGSAKRSRAQLVRWAASVGNVQVLAEVGGDFQYEVTLVARNVSELVEIVAELSERLGKVSLEKSMAIRTSNWLFGTKSLATLRRPLPIIGYDCSNDTERLSASDCRMLASLEWLEEFNVSRLARQLGEPPSTIEYRLRRLEEKGVIAGYFHDYSPLHESVGFPGFTLLIRLKGSPAGFAAEFFEFCQKHPFIDVLNGAIGSWDYKLMARVPSYDGVLRLVDEIHERFDDRIGDIRTVPILKVHRVCVFPAAMPAANS